MSWCRWSSMEFRCDLYVYETAEGVEVDVARMRAVIDRDALPPVGEFLSDTYLIRQRSLMAALEDCERVKIGLPYDGEFRVFDTLGDAADWIDELVALGYLAPEGMTADMRAEALAES